MWPSDHMCVRIAINVTRHIYKCQHRIAVLKAWTLLCGKGQCKRLQMGHKRRQGQCVYYNYIYIFSCLIWLILKPGGIQHKCTQYQCFFFFLNLLSLWVTSIHFSCLLHTQSMATENIAFPKAIGSCTGHAIQSEPREQPKAFQGLLEVMGTFFLCSGGMVALGILTRAREKKTQVGEKQGHDTKRNQVFMGWHCLNSQLQPSMAKTLLTSETLVSVEASLTRVFCQSKEPQVL